MAEEQDFRGQQNPFTKMSPVNGLDFIIERKIRKMVNTSALVRVDSVDAKGPEGPASTLSGTPLVSQIDGKGNAIAMTEIPRVLWARYQAGIAALIIDPVPGDTALVSFCKSDSSNVSADTTTPQRPGSFRTFSQSDGVAVGTVNGKKPEVWIQLTQDKTIMIHAPEGCTVESDTEITLKAPKIVLDAPQTVVTGSLTATGAKGDAFSMTGNVNVTGDVTADNISLKSHTHGGVQTGGGSTGGPQ